MDVKQTIGVSGFTIPGIEDVTRRDFLIGGAGLLALGLAGCGGEGAGEASTGTRRVESLMGPVDLPVRPQRVVPGYATDMDYALALGLPLAAGTGARGKANQPFAAYQRRAYPEKLEGLEKVQGYPEVNLEQVAALRPDCILDHLSLGDENRYEKLSEIAPTYAYLPRDKAEGTEGARPDWKGVFRTVARAFGKGEVAERRISDHEARVDGLRGRLAERWSGAAFAILEPYPEGLYIFGKEEWMACLILFEELGLTPAAFLTPRTQHSFPLEGMAEIDADVLFVSLQPKGGSLERDRGQAAPVLDSPLWKKIPAVEKGQVHELDNEILYMSPLTPAVFLDVVERSLLS